jgi:O-antigen ligase
VLGFAGLIVVALVVVGPAFGLLPASVLERLSDVPHFFAIFDARRVEITTDNFSIVERMAHWQAAWDMFSGRPWLGVGAGNYEAVYPAYALPQWKDPLGHAHNYYLNVLAESGLVGLSGYLVFVGAALALGIRAVRASRGLDRGIALGVLGGIIYLTVHNFLDNLYVHGMNLQVGMLLAIAVVLLRNAQKQKAAGSSSGA